MNETIANMLCGRRGRAINCCLLKDISGLPFRMVRVGKNSGGRSFSVSAIYSLVLRLHFMNITRALNITLSRQMDSPDIPS